MWPGSENTPTPVPEPGELTDRHQTVRFDAFPEGGGVVAMHLSIAERLLAEGAKGRAFTELVRASREVPMSGLLAAALVNVALRAGTGNTAAVLLQQGIEETDGQLRVAVQRSLARLYRRLGDLEKAREQLVLVLAEQPEDRRARAVLNALLEREARWDELDASLEKDTREALRRKDLRRASRAALKRARLWGEKLDNPARAALRHGQAAQYAEQGGDDRNAFLLRVLWLRMLHRSGAPERALGDAFEATLRAGERVGEADRVRAVARELKLRGVTLTDVELPLDGGEGREPTAHAGAALAKAHSTQLELLAVAEEVAARTTSGPEVAAVLQAAADESGDQQALLKLEAHLIARRAWRELADHYRSAAAKVSPAADKVAWLEKLAELLESELDDAVGAARAWAEVAELSGDPHAVQEQVRLHSSQRDEAGVQRALNEGVIRASSSIDRAHALVARAEESLARAEHTAAFADLTAALKVSPGHLGALASLAELGALNGEAEPARRFQQALQALPRRSPGRGELQRRLARLSDQGTLPPDVARAAWAEVVVELPDDEEATARLASLARAAGDTSRLEAALRAQIAKEPRGPRTRKARLDLVRVLDERGSDAQALEELKQAVRHEPGHQEAWVLYAERLKARRSYGEAAWAMEHAATATEDGERRCELWRALATFCREALRDAARAEVYERRAEKLRRELDEEKAARRGAAAELLTAPPSGRHAAYVPAVAGDHTPGPRVPSGADDGGPPGLKRRSPAMGSAPVARSDDPRPTTPPPRPRSSGARPAVPGPVPSAPRAPRGSGPRPSVSGARRGLESAPRLRSSGARPAVEDDRTPAPPPSRPRASQPGRESRPAVTLRPSVPPPPAPPPPDEVDEENSALAWEDDEGGDEVMELQSADVLVPDELVVPPLPAARASPSLPPAPPDDRGSTSELPVPLGDPRAEVAPSSVGMPAMGKGSRERDALFEKVRRAPLQSDGYRALSDHFDHVGDADRASLLLEIAKALDGDPNAAPRAPRLILSATDRAGLKHPALRGDAGELLGLSGLGLCRIFPTRGDASGSGREFHLESGRGAPSAAEALIVGVRVLGLRAPEVHLATDNGPPFSCVFPGRVRILVGRLAVKKQLPDAELRFFAGRALFTQSPDLLALRTLKKEQVSRALQVLTQVLRGAALSAEARVMRDALPPKTWDRLRQLVETAGKGLDLNALLEGARHSANRAGLVVCGGVAPAVTALRAKRALPAEITELVRFAASERYLQLRMRRLGK